MRSFFAVAIGGAFGSVLRYMAQLVITPLFPGFPWAVQVVNLLGAFGVGILVPLVDRLGPDARALLITGLLGGLTTMSSFAFDVVSLVSQKRLGAAALCWFGGAILTLIACATGYALGLGLGLAK